MIGDLLDQSNAESEHAKFSTKKTPRAIRPKGFLRANLSRSAHRLKGEKFQEDCRRIREVNIDFDL